MVRRSFLTLLVLGVLYLSIGLAFHLKGQRVWASCQAMRAARGEFVEPQVFGGALGLVFDVAFWPVYAWANIYHAGTPFVTPCPPAEDAATFPPDLGRNSYAWATRPLTGRLRRPRRIGHSPDPSGKRLAGHWLLP